MANWDRLNTTGMPGVAAGMADYYDRKLIENMVPQLLHTKDAQMRPLPMNNGKRVQFRKFTPYEAVTQPLTEGVTPDGQTLNETAIYATVQPYGRHIEISDEMQFTHLDTIHRETAQLLADQGALSVDTVAREALHSGVNVMYSNGKTDRSSLTRADRLTAQEIRKAVRFLEKQNCKRFSDGYYHAIIGPDTVFDLQSDESWLDPAKYQAKEDIGTGEIGALYGVRFFSSSNAKILRQADKLACGLGSLTTAASAAWTAGSRELKITASLTADQIAKMAGSTARIAGVTLYIERAETGKLILEADPGSAVTAGWNGATILPAGGGMDGVDLGSTLIYGQNAFGCVQLGGTGKNVYTIIKPVGSSGAEDPLDQRGTIGWKVRGFCQVILQDGWMVRVEHGISA